jgi:hypothetical protein
MIGRVTNTEDLCEVPFEETEDGMNLIEEYLELRTQDFGRA